jgi:hypothetical protein
MEAARMWPKTLTEKLIDADQAYKHFCKHRVNSSCSIAKSLRKSASLATTTSLRWVSLLSLKAARISSRNLRLARLRRTALPIVFLLATTA